MRMKGGYTAARRWGMTALTLLLTCALMAGLSMTALAWGTYQGEVVDPATPKPAVTIQGNLVVENGKPTGFYELSLCVQSGSGYQKTGVDGPEYITPEAYALLGEEEKAQWEIFYYPFRTVTAAVNVNTDILTAVNWDVQTVTYESYEGGVYTDQDQGYPRGIDTDPAVQGYTIPQADAFPNITTPGLYGGGRSVALDVEGDPRMYTVEGTAEHYDKAGKSALITLSASAPDNAPVVLTEPTPLVVARFAYDLNRFNVTKVNSAIEDVRNSVTGEASGDGFWMGWDKTTGLKTADYSGKLPLTWLGESDDAATYDFSKSDDLASRTQGSQAVWVHMGTEDPEVDTYFYYYLAAETDGDFETETIQVYDGTQSKTVENVAVPDTEGERVLTEGDVNNPGVAYTFFKNLLKLSDGSLAVELVNQPTFKKSTGGLGGNQILFYDWDDSLIGSLIVGEGDVRPQVNAYVEQNLVHPDLRAGDLLEERLGGVLPDFTGPADSGSDEDTYQNLITSLDREYTYRGSYNSKPDGSGVTYAEAGQPDYDADKAGSKYPLTNKLDYAFYRRLNTVTTIETTNAESGKVWTENYFTVNDLTEDETAALYPWVYGWAIVEDGANAMENRKADWPVMVDSAKLESTWTTFGVGELEGLDPAAGNTQSAFATPLTQVEVTYPGGLAEDWSKDPGREPMSGANYAYSTSTAGANGYLRFADFSDMSAMLEEGQNVLIVKAVYEPGTSLFEGGYYSVVEDSLSVSRLGTAASSDNSVYAFDYQYERINSNNGQMVGVTRAREPAVRAGFVYDAKALDDEAELESQKTFYLKNLADDADVMDVQLTTGGGLWKLEYVLLDVYDLNIANGKPRSAGGELSLKENFAYLLDDGGERPYEERQGTDGFVTHATLNTLLAEATREAKETGSGSLSGHATYQTLQDLNLKRDANQTEYTAGTVSRFRTYFQDLVTRLYQDGVAIDPKTGNVTLGWHQIQQHILMCEAADGAVNGIYAGGVLKSEAECRAIGYEWCRLDTCGANATMPLNSFQDALKALDIIGKGAGDPNYKPAYKAIYGEDDMGGVTGAELMGYGFRRHADGVPYDAGAGDAALKKAILEDLQAAVDAIAAADWSGVTWDRVQVEIIRHRMGGGAPASVNAWWKPTAYAPPTIRSWGELLTYSYQAVVGVDTTGDGQPDATVPDAFDAFTPEQVDKALLDDMIKEHVHGDPDGEYADMGWLRASVDEDGVCVEFTGVSEFASAWKAALKALAKAAPGGGGYTTPELLKTASWEEIQYALLTGSYKTRGEILAEVAAGTQDPLYWNDGGQPELTFQRLLEAINKLCFQSDSSDLDRLLSKGVDPVNNEVYLRKSEGAVFADKDEFRDLLLNVVLNLQANTNNAADFLLEDGTGLDPEKVDNYVLQYLLIHADELGGSTHIPTSEEIRQAHAADPSVNNYWWFDGGAPTGPMPLRDVRELFTAYFWTKGIDHGVSAQNPEALDGLDADTLTALGLRADSWGIPYDEADSAQLVSQVTAALAKMCPTPHSASTLPSAVDSDLLRELQYALLHGEFLPAGSIGESYWWQGGSYPPVGDRAGLLENAYKAYVGNAQGKTLPEAAEALRAITADFVNNRVGGLAMRNSAKGENFPGNINVFLGKLETVVRSLTDPSVGGLGYEDMKSVTQYQLQYFLLHDSGSWKGAGGGLKTDEEIRAELGGEDYWWFTADTDPNAGDSARKELPIDESAFRTFLEDIGNYVANYDTSAFDEGKYTEETLKGFNLRKTAGEEFGDISEFMDYSWSDLASTVYYALQGAGYYGDDGATLAELPSWQQVQYIILNGSYADYETAKRIAEDEESGYTWGYEGGGAPPTRTEKEIDKAAFKTFLEDISSYVASYDTSAFDAGTYTAQTLTDFNLRNVGGAEFSDITEFMDYSWGDLASTVYYALQGAGFYDGDGVTLLNTPSWYEVQYIILNGGAYVDYDQAKAIAEAEYTWGWT